jgi:lipopolysaccharide export system permease protein
MKKPNGKMSVSLLTLIMMGGRLIKYFGVAAQGRLDASILFSIIGYRLPEFLNINKRHWNE